MTGLYTYCNFASVGEDKLAGDVYIKSINTLTSYLAIFQVQTPAPTQVPAFIQAPTFTSGQPDMYTEENLQKATRLALKLLVKGQEYRKANSILQNMALKAWNSNLYYGSSHMEYYYFCQ